MRLLLSNDDGVTAPGLQILYETLKDLGEVVVVAPDRDHSGASNALTLSRPLYPQTLANGFHSVDGTPTDCVHLAVNGLFGEEFDRIVSGINTHANLGDDVLYSGTVAAAVEGRFLAGTAIAVSLVNEGREHYDTAARVVRWLLEQRQADTLPPRTILNINVPDRPWSDLQGVRVTRLGHRSRSGLPQKVICPRGKERYWIGAAGAGDDAGPGTDFHAVEEGCVSITPIQVDMTRYDAFSAATDWSEGLLK
ncbi:5'/3'-nucleotidase SurE [Mangrovitalea sediminis]|uniref:5'/3'-nucleotidase SurE n=1 Tax=Mangrovitalea sediminis TaxID=1982043 RepID=UPI000BE5D02A|nr:5'/3'-nucleotidase SurE [Mangrovitalea sediminis]